MSLEQVVARFHSPVGVRKTLEVDAARGCRAGLWGRAGDGVARRKTRIMTRRRATQTRSLDEVVDDGRGVGMTAEIETEASAVRLHLALPSRSMPPRTTMVITLSTSTRMMMRRYVTGRRRRPPLPLDEPELGTRRRRQQR